ncbi:MAG: hypothetical protein HPM95_22025, partial [Alphaproteobacteria bacterium]|nr:hypothetical protein [Alphaproteobacteria bacterium]
MDRFAWVNRKIFPFTPLQAHKALQERGNRSHLPGPGDRFVLSAGRPVEIQPAGHHRPDEVAESYADLELDPDAAIPQFRPGSYGEAAFEGDPDDLVRTVLARLVGTYYWSRHCASPRPSPCGSATATGWMSTTPRHRRRLIQRASCKGPPAGGYSWLHPSTLKGLFDAEILFPNAFGLWVSNDNLLTEIFHHPSFFVTHLRRRHTAVPLSMSRDEPDSALPAKGRCPHDDRHHDANAAKTSDTETAEAFHALDDTAFWEQVEAVRAELEAAPSPEEGMARLEAAINHPIWQVRVAGCDIAHAWSHYLPARELLCEATHDAVDAVAFRAIRHCGALREPRAVSHLVRISGWPSYFTREDYKRKPVGIGASLTKHALTTIFDSTDPTELKARENDFLAPYRALLDRKRAREPDL